MFFGRLFVYDIFNTKKNLPIAVCTINVQLISFEKFSLLSNSKVGTYHARMSMAYNKFNNEHIKRIKNTT